MILPHLFCKLISDLTLQQNLRRLDIYSREYQNDRRHLTPILHVRGSYSLKQHKCLPGGSYS